MNFSKLLRYIFYGQAEHRNKSILTRNLVQSSTGKRQNNYEANNLSRKLEISTKVNRKQKQNKMVEAH